MNEDMKFAQYSAMYLKAKQLEKTDQNKALDIYFKILSNFQPEGTVYYERPCILLEKQKRYEEAIEICERAIKVIKVGLFNASLEEFEHRLNRLIRKRDKNIQTYGDKNEVIHNVNIGQDINTNNEVKPIQTKSFPQNYISVSFGKSTSSNFPTALSLAKMSHTYIESNKIYQAVYNSIDPIEYIKFIQLYELISNWKSCFVTMNGKVIDRKIVGKLNYCYGDKCRSGSSRFCYGASEFTDNPFGCHRLQISQSNNPWWGFGHFQSNNVWSVNKDAIKKRIDEYSQEYIMCPSFSYDTILEALHKLPNQIDISSDKEWVRAYGGIQPKSLMIGRVVYVNYDNNQNNQVNIPRRNISENAPKSSGCLLSIISIILITVFFINLI